MGNTDGLHLGDKCAIDTYTGKWVNPETASERDISIDDIAHSLSLICRFTGHCNWFYSVGQHSLNVSFVLSREDLGFTYSSDKDKKLTMLAGLLHDAPEAYIGDIARPIKFLLSKYTKQVREIEDRLMGVIVRKFGLSGANWNYIKRADNLMVVTEAWQLMPDNLEEWNIEEEPIPDFPRIGDSRPTDVERYFHNQFARLQKE